jgi:hypothetical protein
VRHHEANGAGGRIAKCVQFLEGAEPRASCVGAHAVDKLAQVENWNVVARNDGGECLGKRLWSDIDHRWDWRGFWERRATAECVDPRKPSVKRGYRDFRWQLVGNVVDNATERVEHGDGVTLVRWQEARRKRESLRVVIDDALEGQSVGSGHLVTLGHETTFGRPERHRTLPVGAIAVNASRRVGLNWSDR